MKIIDLYQDEESFQFRVYDNRWEEAFRKFRFFTNIFVKNYIEDPFGKMTSYFKRAFFDSYSKAAYLDKLPLN